MKITIDLPDDLAQKYLDQSVDLSRLTLESFVLHGYLKGELNAAQVRVLLNFQTRMELDGFLKRAGAYLSYSEDDLNHDLELLRDLPKITQARSSSQTRRRSII